MTNYIYVVLAIITCVVSAVNCVTSLTGEKKNYREALAWLVATSGWLLVWILHVSKI